MILKLIYILCLFFSVYENSYAFKADNISLSNTKQFLPLKDITLSDALVARQKDNASPKIVKNIYNDSSNILNASSSVSELTPQTYPGNKSIDIEKEKKIASHHEHPAFVNGTSTIYKSTDFLLFGNETLVGKYRPMNSTKFDDVNQTRDTDNVTPSNSTKNYDTMKATTARPYALHRMARDVTDSVQTVLKKIFPDRFFPEKSNSDLNGSRNVNNKNNNSSRRRQKIKKLGTRRFGGESAYFRQNAPAAGGAETAAPASNNAQPAAPAANGAQTAAPGADNAQTAAPGADNAQTAAPATNAAEINAPATPAPVTPAPVTPAPATTAAAAPATPAPATTAPGVPAADGAVTTSSGQQVNYHYHFHYFGGLAAPTSPGEAATTAAPAAATTAAPAAATTAAPAAAATVAPAAPTTAAPAVPAAPTTAAPAVPAAPSQK